MMGNLFYELTVSDKGGKKGVMRYHTMARKYMVKWAHYGEHLQEG